MDRMATTQKARKPKPRNSLADVDLDKAEPLVTRASVRAEAGKTLKRKRDARLPSSSRKNRELNENRNLKPPPVPKNRSLAEIHDMDPDDPAFKHPDGSKRKYEGKKKISMAEATNADKQKRANERRARARKGEAEMVKAVEVLDKRASKSQASNGVFDEDLAIAEGLLNLDDWDNEELIRGYRRGRSGQFGKPPKFIPRELQQQAFRQLVSRGDGKLKKAYIAAIEELVLLAKNARSEKVRLDAIKEIQERVVGKIPDRVHVAVEQPWEAMLADSFMPVSSVPPIDLEIDDDNVARMLPDVGEVEPEDSTPSGES